MSAPAAGGGRWVTTSPERLQRTLDLADTPVARLPTGTALVRSGAGWEQVGDVVVHGTLPAS